MKIYIADKTGEHYALLLDTEAKSMRFVDDYEERKLMNGHHAGDGKHILMLTYEQQIGIFNAHRKNGYRLEMA